MVNATKRTVTVQPGGRIEIFVPELAAGTAAEVIVFEAAAQGQAAAVSLATRVGQARGAFASPQEVDRFIRAERDQWP